MTLGTDLGLGVFEVKAHLVKHRQGCQAEICFEAAVALDAGSSVGFRSHAMVDQLIGVGIDPFNRDAGASHVGQALGDCGIDIAGYLEILPGVEGNEFSFAIATPGDGLIGCFVLEGIELAGLYAAVRPRCRIGVFSDILGKVGVVAKQHVIACPVPHEVLRDQIGRLDGKGMAGAGNAVGRGAVTAARPVAVGLGGCLGVGCDMAGLAGNPGHMAVITGGSVASEGLLGGMTFGAFYLGGIIRGSEVRTFAGNLVVDKGMTRLAGKVGAGGVHVDVKRGARVGDRGHGKCAAFHAVIAAGLGMTGETIGPCRLGDIAHHGVGRGQDAHAAIAQADALGGILCTMTHQTVDIGLGVTVAWFDAASRMAGAA